MIIIEVMLGLKSKQGDVNSAFLHEDIGKYEKVCLYMTTVFDQYPKNGRNKCLKLLKTLYGLCQILRAFW